ncbi:MAG: hypothetical protein RQ736_12200 [Thiogranum sp.]|nr:hypothetical protein [Thiogranum sp.]
MQWLNLVPEDAGVQRLKADNRQPVVARSVDTVAPYPETHETRLAGTRLPERDQSRDRRGRSGDRRQGERRQKQVPVLLDTRCGNRRGLGNRRQDAAPADAAALVSARINVYA